MRDNIKQSVCGSYFDVVNGKSWSTHCTLPTFRPVTLISFSIQHERTREDVANAVRQHVTRFTHGAANADAGGIQRLP
ncbi:hypothetical protein TNCV_3487901 [Trichonephila clavipes]|nr:hypothetical protein TNCV_3487901 [Trichonephila clavipes]